MAIFVHTIKEAALDCKLNKNANANVYPDDEYDIGAVINILGLWVGGKPSNPRTTLRQEVRRHRSCRYQELDGPLMSVAF